MTTPLETIRRTRCLVTEDRRALQLAADIAAAEARAVAFARLASQILQPAVHGAEEVAALTRTLCPDTDVVDRLCRDLP